jgi:Zn-dependent protease
VKNRAQTLLVAGLLALGVYAVLTGGHLNEENVLFFCALVPSIILHEVSHGWAALMFGDDTAKQAGRLTLNPIAHIDPFGSIILPGILILATGFAFGYAKPVPVNPRRMRSPRNHNVLVALAGPGTNIVLAGLTVLALRITGVEPGAGRLVVFLYVLGFANVILAVFNLIPIPPLDGSAVIERMLPRQWWPGYLRLRQYSFGLLFLVVFLVPLDRVFDPALNFWESLLP